MSEMRASLRPQWIQRLRPTGKAHALKASTADVYVAYMQGTALRARELARLRPTSHLIVTTS